MNEQPQSLNSINGLKYRLEQVHKELRLKDQLVSNQALKLDMQRKQLIYLAKKLGDIGLLFVCVGGPLNDNVLGYNKEQKKYLAEIYALVEDCLDEFRDDEDE